MIEALPDLASVALQNGTEVSDSSPAIGTDAAAALAVGLGALGSGYAQSRIGAAAVGAVAEDGDNFFSALLFVAIPETLIIIAFVTVFVA